MMGYNYINHDINRQELWDMGCLTCDIMWPPNKIAIGHTIELGGLDIFP